jgi:hypothetical protein
MKSSTIENGRGLHFAQSSQAYVNFDIDPKGHDEKCRRLLVYLNFIYCVYVVASGLLFSLFMAFSDAMKSDCVIRLYRCLAMFCSIISGKHSANFTGNNRTAHHHNDLHRSFSGSEESDREKRGNWFWQLKARTRENERKRT